MASKKLYAAPVIEPAIVFSKEKILKLNRYANRRDFLSVALEDGKNYTLDQVDAVIQHFEKKGKVK